jgi:hypothetical protein
LNSEQTDAASRHQNVFSRSAWEQVSVTASESVDVSGSLGWAQLDVTMTNHSNDDLRPDNGNGVALSFRLLGADGQAIAFECFRTPLQASIPAGASYTQDIQIVIPAEHMDQTRAIRVGMLQLREYWVENVNPEHAAIVKISKGADLSPAQKILAEASQTWPKGQNNKLKWPYNTMMVSEQHKLFYIPVAKCACTSLKSMMVELAGVTHYERAISLGVHRVTDHFNTGAQLKDQSMEKAREMLASEQYLKFAVVREPFERLVSAYLEKFVYNRENTRNLQHTRPVISEVQDTADIDLRRGISFDEFISTILRQDSWDLDPHWRPQYLYMLGVPHISKVFRMEELDKLEAYLLQERGIQVKLGHKNETSKSIELLADAATLSAEQLEAAGAISPDSFLSSRYLDEVRDYYQEDFELYQHASK